MQETPPFLRATTSASMDIPGPFETGRDRGLLQHDAAGSEVSAAEGRREFMTQWYYAAISNVSVHEVWPGHYLQFLYARDVPVRRPQGVRRQQQF